VALYGKGYDSTYCRAVKQMLFCTTVKLFVLVVGVGCVVYGSGTGSKAVAAEVVGGAHLHILAFTLDGGRGSEIGNGLVEFGVVDVGSKVIEHFVSCWVENLDTTGWILAFASLSLAGMLSACLVRWSGSCGSQCMSSTNISLRACWRGGMGMLWAVM
jgi:hypothetical protein